MDEGGQRPGQHRTTNESISCVSSSSEDLPRGNASRRDYPLYPGSSFTSLLGFAEGKFRVIEKPDVPEAYAINLVSFILGKEVGGSNPYVKLVAMTESAERRVKNYPSEIVVDSSSGVQRSSVLVKRLVLFKQTLPLSANCPLAAPKRGEDTHVRSISVEETGSTNIIVFMTGHQPRPCYLADENNQCDCKQVLREVSSGERKENKDRKNRIPQTESADRLENDSTFHSAEKCKEDIDKIHVCMFCGKGLIGGKPCGKLCDDLLKQQITKKYIQNFENNMDTCKENVEDECQSTETECHQEKTANKKRRCCLKKDKSSENKSKPKEKRKFLGRLQFKKNDKPKGSNDVYLLNDDDEIKQYKSVRHPVTEGQSDCKPLELTNIDVGTNEPTATGNRRACPEECNASMPCLPFKCTARDFHFICRPYVPCTCDKQTSPNSTPVGSEGKDREVEARWLRYEPIKPLSRTQHETYNTQAEIRKRFHYICTTFQSSNDVSDDSVASSSNLGVTSHDKDKAEVFLMPTREKLKMNETKQYKNHHITDNYKDMKNYTLGRLEIGHQNKLLDNSSASRNLNAVNNVSSCLYPLPTRGGAVPSGASIVSYLSLGGSKSKRSVFPKLFGRCARTSCCKVRSYRRVFSYSSGSSNGSTGTSARGSSFLKISKRKRRSI